MDNGDLIKNMRTELKRGTLSLIILHFLHSKEYGYSLLQKLEKSKIDIDANTLYPMLRRLEKQGLLKEEWDVKSSRPRKYYMTSKIGKEFYNLLKEEWSNNVNEINNIFKEENNE